jgi:hypothetical protein
MVNVLGLTPLADFQVTLIGRFWVIPEVVIGQEGNRAIYGYEERVLLGKS